MSDPTSGASAPAVTSISRATGGTVGGTLVTVSGSGFTGATGVYFGANGATDVQVVSDTQLTAVSPAGYGTVNITVVTPAGTSATSAAGQFSYISLMALITPSTLPCNFSTTDLQSETLTLIVYNQSSADADMTGSGLRIDFAVDPGGSGPLGAEGPGSALIASAYTALSQTEGSPIPLMTVTASPGLETSWQISPMPDEPCSFLAIPLTGPGQATIAAGASVTFTFADIAVDLIPGVSQVTISVVGSNSPASPGQNPFVNKIEPVLGITSFTAAQVLTSQPPGNPPNNQWMLTWATVAASCQLSWNTASTSVTYGTDTTTTSPLAAPAVVDEDPAVTVTLFADTDFTLYALSGATSGTQIASSPLSISVPPATLYLDQDADPVSPCLPFNLNWSCPTGSDATLGWYIPTLPPLPSPLVYDEGTEVIVTLNGENGSQPISQDGAIPDSGTATVTINVPVTVTFFLNLTKGAAPSPQIVNLTPVQVIDPPIAAEPVVDQTTGQQQTTLSWTVQDATGFVINGPPGPGLPALLPYSQNAIPVTLPAVQELSGPVTYTVAIQGSSPPSATALPVSPTQVHLTGFAVSPPQVTRGHPVTLTWNATFATGFTVTTVSEPSLDFPWNAAQCQVTPMFATTTYVITAHGYTAGQSEPSRSVTVTVEKSKEKEKEKEHKDKEKEDLLEKQSKDIEPQILPGLSTGDSDAPDPGLPSGSQRAFIEPDERPDVGAHLRNDSSGA